MLVHRSRLRGRELRLLFSLLLNLGDLLPLLGRGRDLHSQDDVTDLGLGQGSHVHAGQGGEKERALNIRPASFAQIQINRVDRLLVLFAVICQDEVFELHFDLDPFLIGECGPDVMGLSDGRLVGFQDHLCTIVVHMKGSEDQDEP